MSSTILVPPPINHLGAITPRLPGGSNMAACSVQALASLVASLSAIGAPPSKCAALRGYVEEQQWCLQGSLSRVSQVTWGMEKGILTPEDALAITEQPAFLECNFQTVYEDERLVAVNKPWDAAIQRESSDGRWPGERTLRQYLQEQHQDVFTEGGQIYLCHRACA